jgi:FlaA1/EpsC-like NDP-sugar epimerase
VPGYTPRNLPTSPGKRRQCTYRTADNSTTEQPRATNDPKSAAVAGALARTQRLKSLFRGMSSGYIALDDDRILVTGSNGFIGTKVVEKLLEYGFTTVRCFVRPSSKLDRLKQLLSNERSGQKVEFVIGDLLSQDDCRKATAGVSIIYHLAAGMEKSFAGAFMNSALGTRNLMDVCL